MRRFTAVLVAMLLALSSPLLIARAMPFDPVFDIFVSNPAPSANSNLRFVTSLPAGDHSLGTWSTFVPDAWGISSGGQVFDWDVIGKGTMSVDTDCDGSVQTYGPFDLLNKPLSGPGSPVAEWSGEITSWWPFILTVDQDPPDPIDISTFLTSGISEPHTLCAPQSFIITIFGRSLPHQDVVLTNPNSAGSQVWEGSFGSRGGEHIVNVLESVCVGNTCDYDTDGVADVTDNCDSWPNPNQTLPPWLVPADDPDCDGFSSAVENPVGTNALVQCGVDDWPADVTNDTFSDISDISALTSNFGIAVPPAPARHNIAPDPVDGFVDVTDMSKMTAFFGQSCATCPGDSDCDGVPDVSDNCDYWPNPAQNLPLWFIPPNDPDCDGFSTAVEASTGTNPLAHCGVGAWSADVNNDTFSDITDVSALTASFGMSVPPAPPRQNIAPDPVDTFVDITDVSKMTSFFGFSCA